MKRLERMNLGMIGVGRRKIDFIVKFVKSKIEFRFAKTKKEDIVKLLEALKIIWLKVKDKADIESYGLENPTPSIDYKEDYGLGKFEDIRKLCKKWLDV